MMEFLSLDNLVTPGMLILLQAVLGFDNLLYISLPEASRASPPRRSGVTVQQFPTPARTFTPVRD